MIKYDKTREKWVAYSGGTPLAASRQLKVLTRRFPALQVDESSAK